MQANSAPQPLDNNEEAVMRSFREGNPEAFRLVYGRHVKPLTYFVEKIIRSQPDAEDIVANAFVKLFHARANMYSLDHVNRWLFVTVRNESIDFLRAKAKQQESLHDLPTLEAGIQEHVETQRVRTHLLRELHKEIDHLPKQRKAIVLLYFFEKKSTLEIAELMNLKPQTVLNHKTKALEALRKSGQRLKWLLDGIPSFLIAATLYLLK